VPMFLDFFGLREQPFGVTPDPRFLYLTPAHREAISSLWYGVTMGRGFMALIAKSGIGKTTLLLRLLQSLDARTAYIFQTQCDSREFMRYLMAELGFDSQERDIVRMHEQFNLLAVKEAQAGRSIVIVVDEAQNLDESVLETVRLLSDFETTRSKLVQVILCGQPQLSAVIKRPSMWQLRQRISIVAKLQPLDSDQVHKYINHRLTVAEYKGSGIFTPEAESLIARSSEGIPRNINNICFQALSLAFALQRRTVDAGILNEVVRDLEMDPFEGTSVADESLGDQRTGTVRIPTRQGLPEEPRNGSSHPEPTTGITGERDAVPSAQQRYTPPAFLPDTRGLGQHPHAAVLPSFLAGAVSDGSGVAAQAAKPKVEEPHLRSEPGIAEAGSPTARAERPVAYEREAHRRQQADKSKEVASLAAYGRSKQGAGVAHRGSRRVVVPAVLALLLVAAAAAAWLKRSELTAAIGASTAAPQSQPAVESAPTATEEGNSQQEVESKDESRKDEQPRSAANPTSQQEPESESVVVTSVPGNVVKPSALGMQANSAPPAVPIPAAPPSDRTVKSVISMSMQSPSSVASLAASSVQEPQVVPATALEKTLPRYPHLAKQIGVEGEVVLKVIVDDTGDVKRAEVVSGHPLLRAAALETVREWRYRPSYLNGRATESENLVTVNFSLTK